MIASKIVLIAHAGDYLRVIILHLPVINLIQPSFTPFLPTIHIVCVLCALFFFFFDGNCLLTAFFLSSLFPSLPTEAHKYIIAGKQNKNVSTSPSFVVNLQPTKPGSCAFSHIESMIMLLCCYRLYYN